MYNFDGVNKVISLTSGTTAFDVDDLWSRWIDWLLIGDNSKYQLAMRSVGGDTISPTKNLGSTFFMVNGWRIRPQEANHTLRVNGNLYTDPSGFSPFISTVGSFNVTIELTVSSLVDSTLAQLPEIEYSSFNGRVTLDVGSGFSGVSYPTGTPTQPVNNLTDALAIANYRGFKTIEILSDLTVTTGQDISEFTIRSKSWLVVTLQAGVTQDNTNYENVSLYGVLGGVWNILVDCWVYDVTNFSGWVRGGSIGNVSLAVGTLGFEFGGQSFFDNLVPLYPDTTSIITMNTDTSVSVTNCTDIVTVKSLTTNSVFICGLIEGMLIVDTTCVGGDLDVSGVGTIINNSALVIDDTGLVNPSSVSHAVFEEPMTDHTTTGTFGGEVAKASDIEPLL